eukprot:scaffold43480_cov75-Phaeocystis_antarctica.AAC.3
MAPDDIPFASKRCGALVADMITCRCSFARLARLTFLLCTGCHALCAMAPDDIPFASRRCGALVADMITC